MSNFNKRLIFIVFFLILFIILFSFYLSYTNNPLLYKISKLVFKDESNIPSYKFNQNKYKKKSCEELCDKHICSEYQIQNKKYNMCKHCKSNGKCYDPFKGICFNCIKSDSCENLYGCNGKEPMNPFHNECNTCWPKIY